MENCYNRIRAIREEKNISQSVLADKVGISRRFLCDIESGKSSPSVYTAIKISEELNVALDKLFLVNRPENGNLPHCIRFIDLFCGIGGFRFAARKTLKKYGILGKCVFSSDIDNFAQQSYEANFGEKPSGDITKIKASDIPDFDLLFGGFPCQAFSIIGKREGFADKTRGTLFFEIARIIKEKQPKAFV